MKKKGKKKQSKLERNEYEIQRIKEKIKEMK